MSPAVAPTDDSEVPAVWAALGVQGGVDIHTHFLPERVQAKVWAWFDAMRHPDGSPAWPINYRGSVEERLEVLADLQLRAFTALVYAHKPDMAEWLNGWALDLADRVPALVHGGTFFPEPGAARYVAAALERGAKVFKVHIPVGGYSPNDPLIDDVWRMLEEAGTAVVIHVGSAPMPHPEAGPEGFEELVRRFGDLTLVVAHMGMHEYESFIGAAERHRSVHLDTAVVFTPFNEGKEPFPPHLLDRIAAMPDRIVLGSDFPAIPHDYATQIAGLVDLDMGEGWLRAVLHDNGVRLLRLDEPG
jgi:hypothetical protein